MSMTLEQYESLAPYCDITHSGLRMWFMTPSVLTRWRVESIHTKEPWTLEWIAGFDLGDILVDVGANVGMYTIWAAVTRQARVFAFEPEAQNYAILNRNIVANSVTERAFAYCLGLIDETGLSSLHVADTRVGGSCHAVGEALDYKHDPLAAVYRQGCVTNTLDNLVASGMLPPPNHIKIDVDGFEPKVLAGAIETVKSPACKSILIETNTNLEDHRAMVGILTDFGYRIDQAQVQRAMRKDGTFTGVAEHVFKR